MKKTTDNTSHNPQIKTSSSSLSDDEVEEILALTEYSEPRTPVDGKTYEEDEEMRRIKDNLKAESLMTNAYSTNENNLLNANSNQYPRLAAPRSPTNSNPSSSQTREPTLSSALHRNNDNDWKVTNLKSTGINSGASMQTKSASSTLSEDEVAELLALTGDSDTRTPPADDDDDEENMLNIKRAHAFITGPPNIINDSAIAKASDQDSHLVVAPRSTKSDPAGSQIAKQDEEYHPSSFDHHDHDEKKKIQLQEQPGGPGVYEIYQEAAVQHAIPEEGQEQETNPKAIFAEVVDAPVVLAVDVLDMEALEMSRRRRCIIIVILLLLVLTAAFVGGIFGGSRNGSSEVSVVVRTNSPTITPSDIPSLVPSEYPSLVPSLEPSQNPTSTLQLSLAALIQSRNPSISFENPISPQSLALDWMFTQDKFAQTFLLDSPGRLLQRFALATLWYATGGSTTWDFEGGFGHGWLNTTSAECEWNSEDFNNCTSDGFVTELFLSDDGLSGFLPPEVGLLTTLVQLSVPDNKLETMPSELGQLTKLRFLALFDNIFSGTIPTELGELTALGSLSAPGNRLVGKIPSELGRLTALTFLALFDNRLTGDIPTELGQLTQLTSMSFPNNALNGTIPSSLGRLTGLKFFALFGNRLSGKIPTELGQLTALTSMSFPTNALNGTIPSQLGQLTGLRFLALFANQLSGTLPTELGQLTALTSLNFHDNQLIGTVPIELSQLSQLELLSLRTNALNGTIPSEWGQLTALTLLNLHTNELTGTFPVCNVVTPAGTNLRPNVDCDKFVCECCIDAGGNPCP